MRILMMLVPSGKQSEVDVHSTLPLEVIARSFYVLLDFGAEVVMASVAGGFVPVDRTDLDGSAVPASLLRFKRDQEAREALGDTVAFGDVYVDDFEAALCIGPAAGNPDGIQPASITKLVDAFTAAGKPVSMVLPAAPGGPHGHALHARGLGAHTPEMAATILLDAIGGGQFGLRGA